MKWGIEWIKIELTISLSSLYSYLVLVLVSPENLIIKGYYGEIYLESFRLIKEQDKKRKRCCYFAYRNALLLLYGQSELAVRIAPNVKRDQNITLDIREGSGNGNQEVEFEYELYLVDSSDIFDNGPFQNKNNFFSLPPQK